MPGQRKTNTLFTASHAPEMPASRSKLAVRLILAISAWYRACTFAQHKRIPRPTVGGSCTG